MKTVKIDGVELTEEQIMRAVKELERKEFAPEGMPCYVWDDDRRPEEPMIRYSDGAGRFYHSKGEGCDCGIYTWNHWEPVIHQEIGISLWMATDRDGKTFIYNVSPVKYDFEYGNREGGVLIGENINGQIFDDEPLEILI